MHFLYLPTYILKRLNRIVCHDLFFFAYLQPTVNPVSVVVSIFTFRICTQSLLSSPFSVKSIALVLELYIPLVDPLLLEQILPQLKYLLILFPMLRIAKKERDTNSQRKGRNGREWKQKFCFTTKSPKGGK